MANRNLNSARWGPTTSTTPCGRQTPTPAPTRRPRPHSRHTIDRDEPVCLRRQTIIFALLGCSCLLTRTAHEC